jgi:transposase
MVPSWWATGRGAAVAVQAIVAQQPRHPAEPEGRCGVDLGSGREWAVVAHHDDTIERVAPPAPWKEVHQQQRRLAPASPPRTVGSRAHRHAKTKRAALDRRAANLRRQAIHVLTTRLARRYGTVVVEDLDVAAMQRSMGRRAFHRAVSQAASAGSARRSPTSARRWAAGWSSLTTGLGRPSPIMAAVATGLTSSSATVSGVAPGVGGWWTATRTRR